VQPTLPSSVTSSAVTARSKRLSQLLLTKPPAQAFSVDHLTA